MKKLQRDRSVRSVLAVSDGLNGNWKIIAAVLDAIGKVPRQGALGVTAPGAPNDLSTLPNDPDGSQGNPCVLVRWICSWTVRRRWSTLARD